MLPIAANYRGNGGWIMNIRDLEYLVALAEHRHFRRAADSLPR